MASRFTDIVSSTSMWERFRPCGASGLAAGTLEDVFRMMRAAANPFSRTALLLFVWTHRHTILRWGRSFWTELRTPGPIDPRRLTLIGRVLWAITRDDQLASARQLRHVRLVGDTVVIDAKPNWHGTARLVDELGTIPGIAGVTDESGSRLSGSIDTTAV